MSKITSLDIIGQLERLAEACPWERVSLWTHREPDGAYSFTAYVEQNNQFGFPHLFGHGSTPEQTVDDAVKQTGNREPEISRKAKIAELKDQIEKLQAVVIGLPPYKPNHELSNGELCIRANETVDVLAAVPEGSA